MDKTDKVISLELAKQIDKEHKRLGIVVESEYVWVLGTQRYFIDKAENWGEGASVNFIPAYDVAELVNILTKYRKNDTLSLLNITAEHLGKEVLYELQQETKKKN